MSDQVTVNLIWYNMGDQDIDGDDGQPVAPGAVFETGTEEVDSNIATLALDRSDAEAGDFYLVLIDQAGQISHRDLGNPGLGCKFDDVQDERFRSKRTDDEGKITIIAVDDEALTYLNDAPEHAGEQATRNGSGDESSGDEESGNYSPASSMEM